MISHCSEDNQITQESGETKTSEGLQLIKWSFLPLIQIQSSSEKRDDAFVLVPYSNSNYWIGDNLFLNLILLESLMPH